MKVKDIMSSPVRTVGPDASLKEVAALLSEHAISGMPVVDAAGAVLGVVSQADILRKESADAGERGGVLGLLRGGDDPGLAHKVEARTARDAMTSPALTIKPERPVWAAAAMMLELKIDRLPVVHDGVLIGLISRTDLVRAFTRPDDEIEREIREGVVQDMLWLPANAVAVTVESGIVQLSGTLATRTDAQTLPNIVRKVVGVVAVESRLTWQGEPHDHSGRHQA